MKASSLLEAKVMAVNTVHKLINEHQAPFRKLFDPYVGKQVLTRQGKLIHNLLKETEMYLTPLNKLDGITVYRCNTGTITRPVMWYGVKIAVSYPLANPSHGNCCHYYEASFRIGYLNPQDEDREPFTSYCILGELLDEDEPLLKCDYRVDEIRDTRLWLAKEKEMFEEKTRSAERLVELFGDYDRM